MSSMKIAVLSSCSAESVHFIREVGAHHQISVVLRVRPTDASRTGIDVRRWSANRILRALERRLFYGYHYGRIERRLAERLAATHARLPDLEVIDVPHHRVNSEETVRLLQRLSIDLLIVIGCPLLKRPVFAAPRYGAINVHYGIAPEYRGENTIFWALYHRDFHNLGVTVHQVDATVDAGPILGRAFVSVAPTDDEVALLAKATRVAAALTDDILASWVSGAVFSAQRHRGRNFRKADRRIWHDLIMWSRRNLAKVRLPALPERREFMRPLARSGVDGELPGPCLASMSETQPMPPGVS